METPRSRNASRAITVALGALLVLALSLGALWRVSRSRCFALTGTAICRVPTDRAEVALTFDDGPTALGLDAILPALKAHHAEATFFLIGREMAERPALVRRLVAAGQELGNHSYTHPRLVGRSERFYDEEIEATDLLLRRAGGRSKLFRPPYGKKLFGLPRSVRRHGLKMILWDVEDPPSADPRRFAERVVDEARPGSIILVHAMYPADETGRAAVPMILDGLDAKGLKIVSVGDLLKDARPRRCRSGPGCD